MPPTQEQYSRVGYSRDLKTYTCNQLLRCFQFPWFGTHQGMVYTLGICFSLCCCRCFSLGGVNVLLLVTLKYKQVRLVSVKAEHPNHPSHGEGWPARGGGGSPC